MVGRGAPEATGPRVRLHQINQSSGSLFSYPSTQTLHHPPIGSRAFYDRRISQEVDGEHVSDEFKGYVFRISGGNDKQGFPMRQGVLTDQRVRLLLKRGSKCYRARRKVRRCRDWGWVIHAVDERIGSLAGWLTD